MMRIGTGFDVHRYGPGTFVVLGGVRIAHGSGLLAHSDGDVVIHALCDAIFGALALGDLGTHFPPDEERWWQADSRIFLRQAGALMREHGHALGNADVTVMGQAPRIAPHVAGMREILALDLRVAIERISIKATTTEGLGFLGRGEGIAAQASVLLEAA